MPGATKGAKKESAEASSNKDMPPPKLPVRRALKEEKEEDELKGSSKAVSSR